MTPTTSPTTPGPSAPTVADICLYGTSKTGVGWLASLPDGRSLGDGEPKAWRSFSDAVFLACDDIRREGPTVTGLVRVFASDGLTMAVTELSRPRLYADLAWGPAPVYTIAYDALLAAAEKDDR